MRRIGSCSRTRLTGPSSRPQRRRRRRRPADLDRRRGDGLVPCADQGPRCRSRGSERAGPSRRRGRRRCVRRADPARWSVRSPAAGADHGRRLAGDRRRPRGLLARPPAASSTRPLARAAMASGTGRRAACGGRLTAAVRGRHTTARARAAALASELRGPSRALRSSGAAARSSALATRSWRQQHAGSPPRRIGVTQDCARTWSGQAGSRAWCLSSRSVGSCA